MIFIVVYLIIGIVVGIAETVMALLDMKKLGLKTYDIWPETIRANQVQIALVYIFATLYLTAIWPVQVHQWIQRIVCYMVDQNGEDSA